jgi:hypothetical protein
VFCNASQPEYKGIDLDTETLEDTIEWLKTRRVKVVTVSGHGETTIYNGWNRYCDKMIDARMPLHIISNFAKEFSVEELKTLSRFKSIEVSCDTTDPVLFRKLRRGADLRTLCLNILRLQATAFGERRPAPTISFSCVVFDQNIFQLMDYVSLGKALGIDHFNFCNLTKYPDLKDALNPKHITEMPVELLPQASASLYEAFEFLKREKIKYDFQQGLMDTLNQCIQSLNTSAPLTQQDPPVKDDEHVKVNDVHTVHEESESTEPVKESEEVETHRYTSPKLNAQTRACLDPWQFIMIRANKDILPCCWHQPIYTLGEKQSLSDVLNNKWMKELRRNLLTGNLDRDCINCPSKGWTKTRTLKKKVWHYLNPGIYKFLFPWIPNIKKGVYKDFQLVYGRGWYDLESNPNIKDPDWQNWRWTSKKAFCKMENPKREASLILQGSVDKSIHKEQTVRIKVNDTILDKFIPGTAKFFKEYIITPGMMGEEDKISLIIETDNVFLPSEVNPEITDSRELGIQIYHLFFGEKLK